MILLRIIIAFLTASASARAYLAAKAFSQPLTPSAAALEENLSWQATTAQGLCQVMRSSALASLMVSWKKKGLIAAAGPVSLP